MLKSGRAAGWDVYLNGGRVNTGRDALEWAAEAESRGAGEILLTSMDTDGTKDGYDLEVTKAVADIVSIPVIASGGAGKLEHFKQVLNVGRRRRACSFAVPLRRIYGKRRQTIF